MKEGKYWTLDLAKIQVGAIFISEIQQQQQNNKFYWKLENN